MLRMQLKPGGAERLRKKMAPDPKNVPLGITIIAILTIIDGIAFLASGIAERSGEYALSEALRDIIVQEQDHEIDLKDALGLR